MKEPVKNSSYDDICEQLKLLVDKIVLDPNMSEKEFQEILKQYKNWGKIMEEYVKSK